MLFTNIFNFLFWTDCIEFLGALLITGYSGAALITLLRRKGVRQARLLVTNGVIYALSFKVAGSLLKTIELRTWQQIMMFAVIFTLRMLLKHVFTWELMELHRHQEKPGEQINME